MNSELIRPTGYGFEFDQSRILFTLQNPEPCFRRLAAFFQYPELKFGIASDITVYDPLVLAHHTVNDRGVAFLDLFSLELPAQYPMSSLILRDDYQSRRFFIEPMYKSRPYHSPGRVSIEMKSEGVQKRSVLLAV